MFSARFQRPIVVTAHARKRMEERSISEALLVELIETGDTRHRDATHLWVFKEFANRLDNMLCAVLVIEDVLVVKTVMHHFSLS